MALITLTANMDRKYMDCRTNSDGPDHLGVRLTGPNHLRIDWTRAHQINELVDGAGVTIEGVNFKDGAVVMTSKRAGGDDSPSGFSRGCPILSVGILHRLSHSLRRGSP